MTNLYNKKNQKLIPHASIKTQAQENYFYGKDPTIEIFFSNIETKIAPVIARILENQLINTEDIKEFAGLLHFISSFAFRTKASADQFEYGLNEILKEAANQIDGLKKFDFENNKVGHPEPGAFQVAANFRNWVFSYDLDPFLLVNKTATDFLISDNPLVVFNPMMQRRGEFGHSQGLITKGLLLIFPISPRYCIMLVDGWAYETYCSGNLCEVNNQGDIDQINLLQAISGDQCIFFQNLAQSNYIERICKSATNLKIDQQKIEFVELPEKPGIKFLYTYHLMHTIVSTLSFIRESEEALNYEVKKFGKYPRSQELVEWINENKHQFKKDQ